MQRTKMVKMLQCAADLKNIPGSPENSDIKIPKPELLQYCLYVHLLIKVLQCAALLLCVSWLRSGT